MKTTALVVGKEEQAVLDDGSAYERSESVAHEVWGLVRQARANLRLLAEPVIRLTDPAAVVDVSSAVHKVGA
jgi:hypothetical protein